MGQPRSELVYEDDALEELIKAALQEGASITNFEYTTETIGTRQGVKTGFSFKIANLGEHEFNFTYHSKEDSYLTLTDRPSEGLIPDLTTLKVYQPTAGATTPTLRSGTYMFDVSLSPSSAPELNHLTKEEFEQNNRTLTDSQCVVAFDAASNAFTVTLPGDDPYILQYDAYLMRDNVELTNDMTLSGAAPDGIAAPSNHGSARFISLGSGRREFQMPKSYFGIELVKVSNDGTPLGGAEFELYASTPDQAPIAAAVSDEVIGQCVFSFAESLVTGDNVYIKEVKEPAGYQAMPGRIEIPKAVLKAGETYRYDVVNYPENITVAGYAALKKTDGENPLLSVEFELYNTPDCTGTPIGGPVTSGADGLAVFNGLYPGATYYAKESVGLAGYALSADPIAVAAAASEDDAKASAVTVVNTPTRFTVTKVDSNENNPLWGTLRKEGAPRRLLYLN